jgi:sarcosine oxidase delta subunit
MSEHLASGIICPHCGARYKIETKTNAAGDTVRRAVCPHGVPLWHSDWTLVRRAEQ